MTTYSLPVSTQPNALTVHPGADSTARLTVRCNNNTGGRYTVRVEGVEPSWITVDPQHFDLAPGEAREIALRIHPPADAPPSPYPVILGVISESGAPSEGWSVLDVEVTSPPEAKSIDSGSPEEVEPPPPPAISTGGDLFELSASREAITMLPGSQATIELVARNASGSTLALDLAVEGLPLYWFELSRASLLLGPREASTIPLLLQPGDDAPEGIYPMVLRATGRDDETIDAHLDLTLEITAKRRLSLEIHPSRLEGQVTAEGEVRVSGAGQHPLEVTLSATGSSLLDLTFDPETLTVPANGLASARLRARATRPADTARTVSFSVRATARGQAGDGVADGHFVQLPAAPTRLEVAPPEGSGAGRATYRVRLINPNPVPAEYILAASDPAAACQYAFTPARVEVPPLSSADSTLTVTPLTYHSGQTEKVHSFTVRATPRDSVLLPAEASGRYIQTTMQPPQLTLIPGSQSASKSASYSLRVRNPRPEPLSLEIVARCPDNACVFDIKPPTLTLAANAERTVQLTARPTSSLLPSETRRNHPFFVEARSPDMPQLQQIEGLFVQLESGRIPWLPWVAGALVFLLLLFLARPYASALLARGEPLEENTPPATIAATATEEIVAAPTTVTATTAPTVQPSPTVEAAPAPAISAFAACPEPCEPTGANSASVYPEGTERVFVRWQYDNFPSGSHYVREWTNSGQLFVRYDCVWTGEESGIVRVALFNAENRPLPSGLWELTISLNGETLLHETLEIEGDIPPETLPESNRTVCFD